MLLKLLVYSEYAVVFLLTTFATVEVLRAYEYLVCLQAVEELEKQGLGVIHSYSARNQVSGSGRHDSDISRNGSHRRHSDSSCRKTSTEGSRAELVSDILRCSTNAS